MAATPTITAEFALAWLNRWGFQVIVQDLPPSRRRTKNRVLLQYHQPNSKDLGAVGAPDIISAIERARARGAQQFD